MVGGIFSRFWAACRFLANPFLLLEDKSIEELEKYQMESISEFKRLRTGDLEDGERANVLLVVL